MQTITSINLTNIEDKIFNRNLQRTEREFLSKLIRKFKMTSAGHDLNDFKEYSNDYFALILSISKETARKIKEQLHARGIVLIDGQTWDQYQKDGRRRKTGHRQQIQLAPNFIRFLASGSQWIFNFCEQFKAKLDALKNKAKAANDRWLSRKMGLNTPLLAQGSPTIGSKFKDRFNETFDRFYAIGLAAYKEMPIEKETAIINWLKSSGEPAQCEQMILKEGYATTKVAAQQVLCQLIKKHITIK